jgi:hypothetical protein
VAEMGHGTAAEVSATLEDRHSTAGTRQENRCREPGQPAADDDDAF